jgi:hypothetical protein
VNTAQALHNAARRYCLDTHRHWCEVYATVHKQRGAGAWGYSTKELDTFPRYNVLNAIRVAVETIDPELLDDFTSARSLVIDTGWNADDDFTRNPSDATAANAQRTEREKFCHFVQSLTELDVWNYEPLPYRRVLASAEADAVWCALGVAWGVPARAFWYPLCESSVTGVTAFRSVVFHEAVPARVLRRELVKLGADRVWELREYGPEYVEDVELFEPEYTGAEGVWTAPAHTWVIYTSHEGSVTVAGALLPAVRRVWPDCDQHRW